MPTPTPSPILGMPQLAPKQALPETMVNEISRYAEQGANFFIVKSSAVTAPPGAPADGDAYVIPVGATGAWATHEGTIAFRMSTGWVYITPREGTAIYDQATGARGLFDGAAWGADTTGAPTWALNELPTGAIDGSNTAFSLAHVPSGAGIALYLNGVRQQPGAGKDYTLASDDITMAAAPAIGDVLLCDYQY